MNRYESYKEVNLPWLKEIPEGWEIVKNRNVFKYKKELNKNNLEKNILSLTLNGVINNDINNPIGLSPKDYATYQVFQRNDLVFKLIDLNNIKTSRVGIVHEKGIMSSAYIRFINDKTRNCSKYYYYWFYKLYIEQVFNKLGNGVRETIAKDDLLNMLAPIPPLPEQIQIANYLDWKINEINRLIHIEKEKIKEISKIKKNLITKVVTSGINKSDIKKCNFDWIKNISADYDIKKLKFIGEAKNGLIYNPQDISKEGTIVLRSSNIQSSKLCLKDIVRLKTNIKDDLMLKKNDLLICSRNGSRNLVGKNILIKEDNKYTFGAFMCRFRSDINEFLYWVFNSYMLDYYMKLFSTSTINQLTNTNLYNMLVPIPNFKEQKIINQFLRDKTDEIGKFSSLITEKIEALQSLKQSLISEVVTGKIDVRNVVIPEYEKITLLDEEIEEFDEMEGIEDGN